MTQLVIEIHFPLIPTPGLSEDEYQYPWIMELEDRVAVLTLESDGAEEYDDGEGLRDTYAFFLTGEDKPSVLSTAKRIATGPGLPTGAFVIFNHSEGDMGEGDRVELSAIG
jgi:hypothetical protein